MPCLHRNYYYIQRSCVCKQEFVQNEEEKQHENFFTTRMVFHQLFWPIGVKIRSYCQDHRVLWLFVIGFVESLLLNVPSIAPLCSYYHFCAISELYQWILKGLYVIQYHARCALI